MSAGANIIGVGSALSGMDTAAMNTYFRQLADDLALNTNNAKAGLELELTWFLALQGGLERAVRRHYRGNARRQYQYPAR